MATILRRQLERAEGVILPAAAREVPCAFHALAAITPTPPGAETWEGGCYECGGAIVYHAEAGAPERETRLFRELYRVGVKSVSLGASRRYVAWLAWVRRQTRPSYTPPRDPYARALDAECSRRVAEAWTAFWRSPPAGAREWAAEFFAEDFPLTELEAIIWPPREDHGDNLTPTA